MASSVESFTARDLLVAELSKNDGNVAERLKNLEDFTKDVKQEARKDFSLWFKMFVVTAVLATFIFGNIASWILIYRFANTEFELIKEGVDLSSRLITEKVILATIAGTIIQVSAAFGFIVRYLFPPEKKVSYSSSTENNVPSSIPAMPG